MTLSQTEREQKEEIKASIRPWNDRARGERGDVNSPTD